MKAPKITFVAMSFSLSQFTLSNYVGNTSIAAFWGFVTLIFSISDVLFVSLSLFLFLIFSFLISASRKQTSSMSCPETSNLKFAKINNLMKMHFSQSNPLRIDYLLTDGEIFTDRYLPTYLSFK